VQCFLLSYAVNLQRIYEELLHVVLYSRIALSDFNALFCCNKLQPNFGASLHILKVEIGGDAQSSGLVLHFLNSNLQFIHNENFHW